MCTTCQECGCPSTACHTHEHGVTELPKTSREGDGAIVDRKISRKYEHGISTRSRIHTNKA
eukprot:4438002-Karenia_brevis.AAC.1